MTITGEKEPLILRLPLIVGNVPLKRNFPLLLPVEAVLSDENTTINIVEMPETVLLRYPTLRKYKILFY